MNPSGSNESRGAAKNSSEISTWAVARERIAFALHLIKTSSRLYKAALISIPVIVATYLITRDARILLYGAHIPLWASVFESARRGPEIRQWAKAARPLRLSVIGIAGWIAITAFLIVAGLGMIGVLTR